MTGKTAVPEELGALEELETLEVPETHPASLVYRVFTGMFVFGPPALLLAAPGTSSGPHPCPDS